MQIRRAEAVDEESLACIRQSAILTLAVPVLSMEQAEKWASGAAADRIMRAIREHDVWVAVEGAALYVSPSYSCRGIGSALLAQAETFIRSFGYATVLLNSSPNALDFYLRRGYLRCGPPDTDGAYPLSKELDAVGSSSP